MSAPPYTTALGLSASITRAWIWREVLEFVRLPLPLLRVRRGRFFDRNIWPDSREFRIQRQPFLKPGFAISLDSINGALRRSSRPGRTPPTPPRPSPNKPWDFGADCARP